MLLRQIGETKCQHFTLVLKKHGLSLDYLLVVIQLTELRQSSDNNCTMVKTMSYKEGNNAIFFNISPLFIVLYFMYCLVSTFVIWVLPSLLVYLICLHSEFESHCPCNVRVLTNPACHLLGVVLSCLFSVLKLLH